MDEQTMLLPSEVSKTVDPYIDLGNLLMVDSDSPLDLDSNLKQFEENISSKSRENAQFLFNKIWDLETVRVDEALCAKLPAPTLRLPREKPLPAKKQKTKWEQYAEEKGIRKKKKDRKVYDEQSKEWKPRYGYRRADDDAKNWLIEIPDHKDPMVDYFEERKKQKTERVSKNEMQRLRNIAHSKQNISANSVPIGVSKNLEDRTTHELANQINRARFATASAGKYQPELKNEKTYIKSQKRHQFLPNEKGMGDERKKQMEILEKLSFKKPAINQTRLGAVTAHSSEEKESEKAMGKKQKRPKSAIHRQQHFKHKVKKSTKTRGGADRQKKSIGKRSH